MIRIQVVLKQDGTSKAVKQPDNLMVCSSEALLWAWNNNHYDSLEHLLRRWAVRRTEHTEQPTPAAPCTTSGCYLQRCSAALLEEDDNQKIVLTGDVDHSVIVRQRNHKYGPGSEQ